MTIRRIVAGGILLASALLASPARALAHCDTLDGPVVRDGRAALGSGDLTPALKWIGVEHEAELRRVFTQALAVRERGEAARSLADRFFQETLVRLHRQGEGAPYTGLRPAGAEADPAIRAADEALESGAADPLVHLVVGAVEEGLRARFARAAETRRHAGESVARGRDYVAAYVDYVHFAETITRFAAGPGGHDEGLSQAHAAAQAAHPARQEN